MMCRAILLAAALAPAWAALGAGAVSTAAPGYFKTEAARTSAAAAEVLRDAEKALSAGPWSVMEKPRTPPSGDMHDYFSVPPYWWPNPNTPDGLPYVRKDGVVNPDRGKYDNTGLYKMCGAVETLALAHALTDDAKYAARAALVLNTWFLDPATRMNPNLNFAQGVPGRSEGRAEGIIDTAVFARLMDCLDLLAPGMAPPQRDGLKQWFSAYLDWLLNSPLGKREAMTKNNHASCYDVQVARIALYTGREEVTRKILGEVAARRIDTQIEADGRQPHELARTKSFGYSVKNLEALMDLADMATRFDVDLWGHVGPDGRGIRRAFDFMVAHTVGGAPWPGENIDGIDLPRFLPLIRRAATAYGDGSYAETLEKAAPAGWAAHRAQLWYPKGASAAAQ